jgi:O-antigen/teichoic acid export membrane protein
LKIDNKKPNSPNKSDYYDTDHLKSGLRRKALKGATATVIAQGFNFIIQTTSIIILARLLIPHDFGLVTMVLSFSLLLQGFGCNGFIEAVIQCETINHKQISTLFWINVGISLILMLLFIAIAPIIVWFYNEPALKSIAMVMAVSILFGGLSNQHVSLLNRNMQFLKTSVNEVIAAFISAITSIALAWKGLGYWALVAKWVISPLMITIGAWLLCSWRPGVPSLGNGIRPILRFAFHTYGNFILTYFRRNIDKILIGRSLGSQQLGHYDRAYHLSNMLPNQILNPLNSVSIASFSRISNDSEKYRYNYLAIISIIAFICMPLSATLTLISYDLILFLLGPKWNQAQQIFCAFGPSIGVSIIYLTHGWLHLSLGTPERWFRWGIIEFIVTALFLLIGLKFGALGVAVAYSISFYVLIGPALWYAGKKVNLKISSIFSKIWKYYVSAFSAGLLCWFILYSYGSISHIFITYNTLNRIIVAGILCISLYLLIIKAFFRSMKPLSEFISIIREVFQRDRSGE